MSERLRVHQLLDLDRGTLVVPGRDNPADGSLGRHAGATIRLDQISPYFERVRPERVDFYTRHVGRIHGKLAERMEARASTLRVKLERRQAVVPGGRLWIREEEELDAIEAILAEMRAIEPQAAGEGRPAPLRLVQGTAQGSRAAGADSLSQNPAGEAGR